MANIAERVRLIPGVRDVDALVLPRRYLLPSKAVVLHVIDDLETELQKEPKHNSKAQHPEAPEVVDHSQVNQFSQLHQENPVGKQFHDGRHLWSVLLFNSLHLNIPALKEAVGDGVGSELEDCLASDRRSRVEWGGCPLVMPLVVCDDESGVEEAEVE